MRDGGRTIIRIDAGSISAAGSAGHRKAVKYGRSVYARAGQNYGIAVAGIPGRPNIPAQRCHVRQPIALRKLRFRPVEAAVDSYAVFHPKSDIAVGARGGFVGALSDPDFRYRSTQV